MNPILTLVWYVCIKSNSQHLSHFHFLMKTIRQCCFQAEKCLVQDVHVLSKHKTSQKTAWPIIDLGFIYFIYWFDLFLAKAEDVPGLLPWHILSKTSWPMLSQSIIMPRNRKSYHSVTALSWVVKIFWI